MKKITLIAYVLIIIGSSCKKDKSPNPTGSTVTSGSLTPWENSLVGQWKLKRSEIRSNAFSPGLGDSTFQYTNHYNYINSQLNLTASPDMVYNGTQYYHATFGYQDNTPPESNWAWAGGAGSSIDIPGTPNIFSIIYLSTDSLVLDYVNGGQRLFFNKTTTPPVLNNIESKLVGGIWTQVTHNGSAPLSPTFKMFFNNWYSTDGYLGKDSTTFAVPFSWQVLFPNRAIPIFYTNSSSNGPYYKITTLTANSLTLEYINPGSYSTTLWTDVYSR